MNKTKQVYYNQVRGVIEEINDNDSFPSITLVVGHEVKRHINIVCKPPFLASVKLKYQVGDTISIQFFVSSRFKHGRWYTMANALEILE